MEIAHGGHQGDPESPGPPVRRQGLYLVRIADDLHKKQTPGRFSGGFRTARESRSVITGSKPWVLAKPVNLYHLCQEEVKLLFECGIWGNGPEEFPGARRLGAGECPGGGGAPWFELRDGRAALSHLPQINQT